MSISVFISRITLPFCGHAHAGFRTMCLVVMAFCITALLGHAKNSPQKSAEGASPPVKFDLQKFIDTRLKKGERRIVIPPGRYKVQPSGGTHLRFVDLRDVEIVADGVEMVCSATVLAMSFEACRNVTLRGLTVDYDPLPFTQGEIVALGPEKSWVEFQLFDGYPDNELVERIEIFDPANRELRRASYYGWGAFERVGPRRYRISKGSGYRYRETTDTEQVGDLLVTNNRTSGRGEGHAVRVKYCSGLKLQDVTLYSSPSFGFLETDSTGSTYLRCRIDRRAPENDWVQRASPRLRSLNADAFHSKNAVKGPAIIGCYAHWQGDDCVNINGRYYFVASSEGRAVRIVAFDQPVIKPGDLIDFLPYAGAPLPQAKAVSIEPATTPLTASEQELLDKVRFVETIRNRLNRGARVYSLVLDREVNPPPGSMLCAASRIGSGFVVKDCDFGDNRSRGILIKASKGEVTGNRVYRSRMAAILISPEFHWMEAGSSKDVVVKDNVLIGIGQTPIRILANGGSGKPLAAGAHNNISVVNNRFEDCPWPLLEVNSTTNLTIAENVWPQTAPTVNKPAKDADPILLVNCEKTDIRQ